MTEAEIQLWNRLQNFQLDDTNAAFQFSHRLAAENGWSRTYTLRVLEEYKRFLFLCCISNTPVTPSDAVDQAWHLHLLYTRSYWDDLCKNVLQQDVHHGPTKGGQEEAEKFDGMYTLLKDIYEDAFQERPPADIWLSNEERFRKARFQRVNRSDYWMIRKPVLRRMDWKPFVVGMLILGIFVRADDSSAFLFPIIVFALFLIFLIRNMNKEDGSGCSGGGCGGGFGVGWGDGSDGDSGHGHHGCGGHHGCSGDGCSSGGDGCSSGCGGGGCSGCGGGCGGGD